MITRRTFLAGAAGAAAYSQNQRLNVLMLAVDDWNDWVGALGGHPQVTTPNLDRLAAKGMLFTDAHTAAPICNPSRTALMTGRRPSTTGIYGNDEEPWRKSLPDVITLPQHFRTNGYKSLGGGKVFHHGKGFNDIKSWDEYYFWNPKGRENGWFDNYSFPPDPEPARPVTPMPSVSWRNFDWAPIDVAEEDMPDFKVSSWASDVLAACGGTPRKLAAAVSMQRTTDYADSVPESSSNVDNGSAIVSHEIVNDKMTKTTSCWRLRSPVASPHPASAGK